MNAERGGAGDFFWGVGAGEDGFERVGAAVVEELDSRVDAAERWCVEAFVAVARGAEADVVDLAVGEVGAAVAGGAGGFVAIEDDAPALLDGG